jgi:hypothetical protein
MIFKTSASPMAMDKDLATNILLTQNSQANYPNSRLEIDPKQLKDNMSPIIKDKLHKSMIATGNGGIISATRNANMLPQTPSGNKAREGLPELIHKRRYKNRINFNSMFNGNQGVEMKKDNGIF